MREPAHHGATYGLHHCTKSHAGWLKHSAYNKYDAHERCNSTLDVSACTFCLQSAACLYAGCMCSARLVCRLLHAQRKARLAHKKTRSGCGDKGLGAMVGAGAGDAGVVEWGYGGGGIGGMVEA